MSKKLSPYGRKEWHRKRSGNKMVHKSVDAAFRVAGSAVGTMAKTKTPDRTLEEWQRANLTGKQLLISCIVGAVLPVMALLGADEISGMYLVVVAFFFLIPFLVMVLIFMIFNTITRSHTMRAQTEGWETVEEERYYSPNPEWMGQTDLVGSRANARILAPQFLKQAQESAKILQTTTDPSTFFTRYDFCVGRLMELEKCRKYGASVSVTADLAKYRSLVFRDGAVNDIIHRTEEKYRTKIESLKTPTAKKSWAEKYHQAFEPYLSYMSDRQKTVLGEVSAELFALADGNALEDE